MMHAVFAKLQIIALIKSFLQIWELSVIGKKQNKLQVTQLFANCCFVNIWSASRKSWSLDSQDPSLVNEDQYLSCWQSRMISSK